MDLTTWEQSDNYILSRKGTFENRSLRFLATCEQLQGISDNDAVMDVGAGWTELDYFLRTQLDWRGRYIPVDQSMQNIDLNNWEPYRTVEHVVALDIIEHLDDPGKFLETLTTTALSSVIITTPHPEVVDVLGMDSTHVSEVGKELLEHHGFTVTEVNLYHGYYSNGFTPDGLLGVWRKN